MLYTILIHLHKHSSQIPFKMGNKGVACNINHYFNTSHHAAMQDHTHRHERSIATSYASPSPLTAAFLAAETPFSEASFDASSSVEANFRFSACGDSMVDDVGST